MTPPFQHGHALAAAFASAGNGAHFVFYGIRGDMVRNGNAVVPPDDFDRMDDLHDLRIKIVLKKLDRRVHDLPCRALNAMLHNTQLLPGFFTSL
jgi:hypothetical protein